jgi:pimeloyl-ACP methyl ester carboxylesterase
LRLALGFALVTLAPAVTSPAHADMPAAVRLVPCGPEPTASEALCGTVSVPEDPDRPDGRRLALDVVVLPALEGLHSGGAMFELGGGPGLTVTEGKDFYLGPGREFRRGRDVVLADQRGAGHGPQALRCARLEARSPLDDDYAPAAVAECRAELERRADLTQYGTWNAAGDLDLVRAALGHQRIDLWALSYGTKLAQIYIKRFPERVRTAFLVGTAPIDFQPPLFHAANAQRALDALFFDCQTDASCRGAYPDLRGDWQKLLARLDAGPVRVTLAGAGGEQKTVEIRRGAFAEAVRGLMSMTSQQRQLPRLIHRAAAGDYAPLVSALGDGPSPFAEGLYLAVDCAEGAARIAAGDVGSATAGTFLGSHRLRGQLDACAQWPQGKLADGFFAPATAEVPVLMVSGDSDHVTPPEWSLQVCSHLPGCRLVRVPHLGHAPFDLEAWTGGDCVDRLALDLFARGSAAAVDAGCVSKMTPPPFAVDQR